MDPIKSGKFWFCFAHYRFVAGATQETLKRHFAKNVTSEGGLSCVTFFGGWNALLYVYTPKDEWSNWFCFTLEVAPKLPFVRECSSTPIVGVSMRQIPC